MTVLAFIIGALVAVLCFLIRAGFWIFDKSTLWLQRRDARMVAQGITYGRATSLPPHVQILIPEDATTHDLKCWPDQFQATKRGEKVHEFRFNDRGFKVGDMLHLREFDPSTGKYTGEELRRVVTYVGEGFGMPVGFVCLSVYPL